MYGNTSDQGSRPPSPADGSQRVDPVSDASILEVEDTLHGNPSADEDDCDVSFGDASAVEPGTLLAHDARSHLNQHEVLVVDHKSSVVRVVPKFGAVRDDLRIDGVDGDDNRPNLEATRARSASPTAYAPVDATSVTRAGQALPGHDSVPEHVVSPAACTVQVRHR